LNHGSEESLKELSEAAEDKIKIYSCVIKFNSKISNDEITRINSLRDIEVLQKTPLWVLHRWAPLTRNKIIHRVFLHQLNDYYFICFLMTSAGTYVKEFIHSDLGRTQPNIGSLLNCKADIL
jgi:tRNA pseudouridine synthase 10